LPHPRIAQYGREISFTEKLKIENQSNCDRRVRHG
jgi:hypothetical protein